MGAKGEAIARYCEPLATQDLEPSGFCNIGVNASDCDQHRPGRGVQENCCIPAVDSC